MARLTPRMGSITSPDRDRRVQDDGTGKFQGWVTKAKYDSVVVFSQASEVGINFFAAVCRQEVGVDYGLHRVKYWGVARTWERHEELLGGAHGCI